MPRSLGVNPETGEEVVAKLGKFGPYVESGKETRSLDDWRKAVSLDLFEAIQILKQPKVGRGARSVRASAAIKDFGQLEGAAGPIKVMSGRYGPYVTDGTTNA